MAGYILTIDQGTTGTTALLVDQQGKLLSKFTKEYTQIYPRPGWVEHDPNEIWQSVEVAVTKAIETAGAKPNEILAIGITNQRETVILWDKNNSKPVYNAIVWQCRRTSDYCENLKKDKLLPIE